MIVKFKVSNITHVNSNFTGRTFGELRDPIRNYAYANCQDKGEIIKIELGTWRTTSILTNLNYLRGIAVEHDTDCIYVISNQYKLASGEFLLKAIENKNGLGRLWQVNAITGKTKPITKIRLLTSMLKIFTESHDDKYPSMLWKQLTGLLRWPYSVVIEKTSESVFVTEARSLCRVDLKSGGITLLKNIPLCFNLVGIAVENEDNLLLLDTGVSGSSYGRLMRFNLQKEVVTDYLIEGKRITSIAINPKRNSILVSQGSDFPKGRVFELDLTTNEEIQDWEYLNKPVQIAVEPNGKYALVTTIEGLYKLSL